MTRAPAADSRLVLWAYAAQLSGGPLGLLLMPLLLLTLSAEELGLWYVMLTLGALVGLAENALEPALTRYLVYASQGARELPGYGARPVLDQAPSASAHLPGMLAATRLLYGRLGLVNALFWGLLGGLYVGVVTHGSPLQGQAVQAWLLFSIAQALGCRAFANVVILLGLGHTAAAQQALTVQRLAFLVIAIVGLLIAPRLEVLALAQGGGVLLGLGLAARLRRRLVQDPPSAAGAGELSEYVRKTLRSSVELWASRIGAFMIVRANLVLVAGLLDLKTAARLALAMQLVETLTLLAQTLLLARMPRLYGVRAQGDTRTLHLLVGQGLVTAWCVFLAGAAAIGLLASPMLALIGRPDALLAAGPLALLLLTAFLEMNHSLSATLLLLENKVPFVKAALLSGALIVVLSTCVLLLTDAGVIGALLVAFVVQLAYNNWKWPLECLRALGASYPVLVRAAFRRPAR